MQRSPLPVVEISQPAQVVHRFDEINMNELTTKICLSNYLVGGVLVKNNTFYLINIRLVAIGKNLKHWSSVVQPVRIRDLWWGLFKMKLSAILS